MRVLEEIPVEKDTAMMNEANGGDQKSGVCGTSHKVPG